jgi:hypothetical protein
VQFALAAGCQHRQEKPINNNIRRSKKAVSTLSFLVMRGVIAGFSLGFAGLLVPLGIGMVSILLSQPQRSLTNIKSEEVNLLLAGCAGVFMLILGVIATVRTIKDAILHKELREHGVTTRGHIVDQWIAWFDFSAGKRLRRYIAYEYSDEYSNSYVIKQPIPLGGDRYAQIGTPVTVRYLPRDPSISQVEIVDDKRRVP